MSSNFFSGYTLDEIESASAELLLTAEGLELSGDLQRLALCMAIVKSSCQEDLDAACMVLDLFAELLGTGVAVSAGDGE